MTAPIRYAGMYRKKGWLGTLICPLERKGPPPKDFTGRNGRWPTDEEVTQWSLDQGNILLRLPENVIGIDVDDYEEKTGGEELRNLMLQFGKLPTTWKISSRDGVSGIYLYKIPDDAVEKMKRLRDPSDSIQLIGHAWRFVTAPPSIHPEGRTYELYGPEGQVRDLADLPRPEELVSLPDRWCEGLCKQHDEWEKRQSRKIPQGATIYKGELLQAWVRTEAYKIQVKLENRIRGRNKGLYTAAYMLGRLGGREAIEYNAAELICLDGASKNGLLKDYGIDEAVRQIENGWNNGIGNPWEPWPPFEWPRRSWDDYGNADRIFDHFGGEIYWLYDAKTWAVWENGKWYRDSDERASRTCRKMIESLPWTEALAYSAEDEVNAAGEAIENSSPRDKFRDYAQKLRYVGTKTNILNMAKAKEGIEAYQDQWDEDPWLLGTPNGILDLRTGLLSEPSPELFVSKFTNVPYVRDAECPRFMQYLERVQPSEDARAFLQRWDGYCLTGSVSEQCFVMHYGFPNTGKSVMFEVCEGILGDYYVVANQNVFHQTNTEQHPTALAKMAGARFIQASESREGRKLDEAIVNAFGSSEPITARFMNQNEFTFRPTGKINYATNHKPSITATSGTWRRLVLAGWEVVIPEHERDKELGKKLLAEEAEGIFAWMVEGCMKWQKDGLQVPLEWDLSKAEYMESEDYLMMYLYENFDLSDPNVWTSNKDIYSAFPGWCYARNHKVIAANKFSQQLKDRGFKSYRDNSVRGFYGIKKKPDSESGGDGFGSAIEGFL